MANKISNQAAELAADLVGILLFALVLGLLVYLLLVFVAYVHPPSFSDLKSAMKDREMLNIGLPIAGLTAFGIVTALLHVFPPDKSGGAIKVKVFGLEFTGPAGPITLWIATFLAIVVAMKALS